MADVILGVDLSLRGLGLVAIPSDWDLDMRKVRAVTLAVPLKKTATVREQVERLRLLSLDVRTWAIRVGATRAFIESYAFNMATMAHSLGELGGVVKLELMREARIEIAIANQTTARKLMYGRTPPKGLTQTQRKAWLLEPLKLAGAPIDGHDQADAMVAANYGLAQFGAPHLQNLCGPPPSKASKRRAGRAARELFDGKVAAE